jgi:hypothetical protein
VFFPAFSCAVMVTISERRRRPDADRKPLGKTKVTFRLSPETDAMIGTAASSAAPHKLKLGAIKFPPPSRNDDEHEDCFSTSEFRTILTAGAEGFSLN